MEEAEVITNQEIIGEIDRTSRDSNKDPPNKATNKGRTALMSLATNATGRVTTGLNARLEELQEEEEVNKGTGINRPMQQMKEELMISRTESTIPHL